MELRLQPIPAAGSAFLPCMVFSIIQSFFSCLGKKKSLQEPDLQNNWESTIWSSVEIIVFLSIQQTVMLQVYVFPDKKKKKKPQLNCVGRPGVVKKTMPNILLSSRILRDPWVVIYSSLSSLIYPQERHFSKQQLNEPQGQREAANRDCRDVRRHKKLPEGE